MTTANIKVKTDGNGIATMPQTEAFFKFPDPPERTPEMTTFDHLSVNGNVHYLIHHLGKQETTLVAGERYVSLAPTRDMTGLRYPDLIVAFDVDPAAYKARNAYVISDQGKAPDFVLEIASRSTGSIDTGVKRDDYAALGITEYWRFDETGEHHGTRLAGDRLVDGQYDPIPIVEIEEGVLEGYSATLHLNLRWQHGQLAWHDPDTNRHILTMDDESERADNAEARADNAEARADALEAELRRLRS